MSSITIKKEKIELQKGMVILPLKEYRKLLEQAVPTYYLTGEKAKKIDSLVKNGIAEYKNSTSNSRKQSEKSRAGKKKYSETIPLIHD